ncbi:hypothetical protein BH11BAC3_BH11BAC3_47840 [soil metagenome]
MQDLFVNYFVSYEIFGTRSSPRVESTFAGYGGAIDYTFSSYVDILGVGLRTGRSVVLPFLFFHSRCRL